MPENPNWLVHSSESLSAIIWEETGHKEHRGIMIQITAGIFHITFLLLPGLGVLLLLKGSYFLWRDGDVQQDCKTHGCNIF